MFRVGASIAGLVGCCLTVAAHAAVVNVGPTTVTSFQTPWYMDPSDNQNGGSGGIVPSTIIDADGAARLRGDRTRFVAGNQFLNAPVPGSNLGLIGNLTEFKFTWAVTAYGSGPVPVNTSPALRVHCYDPALGHTVQFIWENGAQAVQENVVLGTPYTSGFFGAPGASNVHVFTTGFGNGLYDAGGVLIPGSASDLPFNTLRSMLSPTTYIMGISLGVGSYNGFLTPFVSYADHVKITIAGGIDEEYNFVNAGGTGLSLTTQDACIGGTDQLVVHIDLQDADDLVVGGQFFLHFDTAALQFVSATPATFPSPFTQEIFESVSGGDIDYAVGVAPGAAGVVAGRMATLTFNRLTNACTQPGLVTFRPGHLPPTRVTNNLAQAITPLTESGLGAVTLDASAPIIVCPPGITVNADAGLCTAVLNNNEPFDASPPLGNLQAPGVYYTDRYAPAGFVSASFMGDSRLKHSISTADSFGNRPPSYQSTFYNTQGRKLDIDMPVGQTLGIDLYIDPTWIGGTPAVRRADLWATGFDGTNAISSFPIMGFASNDPADESNPIPASPTPRWRIWDDINGVWINLLTPPTAGWHRLEITLTSSSLVYKLDSVVAQTLPNSNTVRFGNTILQAYNFGNAGHPVGFNYDVYWDNLTVGPRGPVVVDNCSSGVSLTFTRSDNAALTLQDPFPSGVPTTVTWTAVDACGNTSMCQQTVTVNAFNTLNATVQLAGVSPGTYTRAVTFNLYSNAPMCHVAYTTCQTMTFVNGTGTANIDVPCGSGPYSCITASDRLHTLRRTDETFHIAGPVYVANFTGYVVIPMMPPTYGNSLIGGNINEDDFIDILDFGGFVGQFGFNFGTASTTCSTLPLHADFSGDGVVGAADFSFIQTQFLFQREPDCCGGNVIAPPGQQGGPTLRISSEELVHRDMADLRVADLNHDGWLDSGDVAAFLNGARPCAADLNRDGVLNSLDFFDFLTGFFASDADYNNNGQTSSDDFFMFLNDFFNGC